MNRLFLLVVAAAAMLGGQAAAPPAVVIRAARLIDVRSGAVVSPALVVVRGDRIEAVGASTPVPDGARVIDLGRATLVPGLIDLHTHLTSTGVHWEDELLKTTPGQAASRPRRLRPRSSAGATAWARSNRAGSRTSLPSPAIRCATSPSSSAWSG